MHHCQAHPNAMAPGYHPGLLGVFGGFINLTTAALQGGARLVRTVVEGSIWHGCHDPWGACQSHHGHGGGCGCHHGHPHGCCHVECQPPSYPGCHRCC